MRLGLLAALLLGACTRVGTSHEDGTCLPVPDRSVSDSGRDMIAIADTQPPVDCDPLTALQCDADDVGCERVFRCASVDLDFRQGKLPAKVTFSRSSPAYHVNAAGALVLAPVDTPRFDHSPSTGKLLGLLVEGQRTNLIPWSSALDKWTPENATTKDTGILGPAGHKALVLEATGGAVPHRLRLAQIPSFTYTWLSLSFFVKPLRSDHGFEIVFTACKNNITIVYDLQTQNMSVTSGSLTRSGDVESFPGGWLRLTFSGFWPGGAVTSPVDLSIGIVDLASHAPVAGDGKESFAVWGLQLEQGPFATSYIPTSGSPAVRAADRVGYSASQAIPLTGGTLLLEAVYRHSYDFEGRTPAALAATGATGTTGTLSIFATKQLEVSASGPLGGLTLLAGTNSFGVRRPHRAVVWCDGAQWGLYEGGARVATATSNTGAVNVQSFALGTDAALDPFFGHLRRLTFWSAPLAPATVEVLAR